MNDRDFDFGTARVIGHGSRREQYEQARPWRSRYSVFDPGRKRAGVVDEYGRVYDVTKHGSQQPFYDGLYIADASVIPSALGVNPSLTISALALRIADKLIDNLPRSLA